MCSLICAKSETFSKKHMTDVWTMSLTPMPFCSAVLRRIGRRVACNLSNGNLASESSSSSNRTSYVRLEPVAHEEAEMIADELMVDGFASVIDDGYIDAHLPECFYHNTNAAVTHARRAAASAVGESRADALNATVFSLESFDWVRDSMALNEPKQLCSSLWCVDATTDEDGKPLIEERQSLPTGARAVYLENGLAFGTGEHPTTAVCAEVLEEHANELGNTSSVLDLGSGSGILSIACALLGARSVLALDTDDVAVRATRRNAALSGVADRVSCTACDAENPKVVRQHDVVVANILTPALLSLAPVILHSASSPGSLVVLSGVLEGEQERSICERYRPHLAGLDVRKRDGWCCIFGRLAS